MIDCSNVIISLSEPVSVFFLSQGNRISKALGLQMLKGGEGALWLIST